MKSWKNRFRGGKLAEAPKSVESVDELTSKREVLLKQTGQHQFHKAVIDAELLQMNQELLRLNNELKKAKEAQPVAPVAIVPEIVDEPTEPG